jgi:hypothetical protein
MSYFCHGAALTMTQLRIVPAFYYQYGKMGNLDRLFGRHKHDGPLVVTSLARTDLLKCIFKPDDIRGIQVQVQAATLHRSLKWYLTVRFCPLLPAWPHMLLDRRKLLVVLIQRP